MNQKTSEREELIKKLEEHAYFMRGSLNDYCANCNRAKCVCKTKTKKRSYRLTYKDRNQKTRVVYVPRTRVSEVKKMLANHHKLKAVLEKLIQVNIKKFKDSG